MEGTEDKCQHWLQDSCKGKQLYTLQQLVATYSASQQMAAYFHGVEWPAWYWRHRGQTGADAGYNSAGQTSAVVSVTAVGNLHHGRQICDWWGC